MGLYKLNLRFSIKWQNTKYNGNIIGTQYNNYDRITMKQTVNLLTG